ncbi:MAG: hypothetical protein KAT91_00915 [Candidatus Aenigmarchaeota archaeon]|nr:hypothetical protein [Candidatus Aenigmarchaeota archaeon]
MDGFNTFILALGILFFGFLLLIGSIAGITQMLFMVLIYIFRKQLRFLLRSITKKDFILVVIFGTIFGLIEEILWYVTEPGIQETMFDSLYIDLVSTLPAYLIFFIVVYGLAKRTETTQKKAFLYGGIFGYIFYFIAESGLFGFQFGGIPGTPIFLILIWEVNNFFLNGLLVWFPLYVSGLLKDND